MSSTQQRKTSPSGLEIANALSPYERSLLKYGPRFDIVDTQGKAVLKALSADLFTPFAPNVRAHMKKVRNDDGTTKLLFKLLPGAAEHDGLKQVADWLLFCTDNSPVGLKAPNNLLGAIKLARALHALGMKTDAANVDRFVNDKLRKALHPAQVKGVWEDVPRDTKYVHAMIQNLARAAQEQELPREAAAYINANTELGNRVCDPKENDGCLAKKETPEQYAARHEDLAKKAMREKAFREKQALNKKARAEHEKAAKAVREANDPSNHKGGAWEAVLRPGQQTRTGL